MAKSKREQCIRDSSKHYALVKNMLLIPCPWCGPREEGEFSPGGEAHIARPANPDALSDEAWADYLFMRTNPRGRHLEQWVHTHGCRRWFNVERDTVTYRIRSVYKVGEAPPGADA